MEFTEDTRNRLQAGVFNFPQQEMATAKKTDIAAALAELERLGALMDAAEAVIRGAAVFKAELDRQAERIKELEAALRTVESLRGEKP